MASVLGLKQTSLLLVPASGSLSLGDTNLLLITTSRSLRLRDTDLLLITGALALLPTCQLRLTAASTISLSRQHAHLLLITVRVGLLPSNELGLAAPAVLARRENPDLLGALRPVLLHAGQLGVGVGVCRGQKKHASDE